jgi:heme/copper-type cytochrome/quinol oxidase subunit 3
VGEKAILRRLSVLLAKTGSAGTESKKRPATVSAVLLRANCIFFLLQEGTVFSVFFNGYKRVGKVKITLIGFTIGDL